MRNVQIITDSCADLGRGMRERYAIDYVRMNVVIHGEEKLASLDWDLYTPKELYDVMRGGERVTTTQVPAPEFRQVFEKYTAAGCDIVYVACSGALSGSINTGRVVAAQLMQERPEASICCVDALNSGLGEGLIAIRAAELRDAGKTAAEIAGELERVKLCAHQFGTVDSLDTLRRAGRVKATSAFMGNLFGVKPILISDANGQNVPIKKVKGRRTSLDECVRMLSEALIEPEKQCVCVAHADTLAEGEYVAQRVKDLIHPKEVYLNYIGPIIGASVGPGTIIIYGWGNKVETVG